MKTRAILISIAMFHWIFYGFWIIPVIINPEVWFFAEKFSGHIATALHLSIGISGFVLGWLVYKKKNLAYVGGVILFGIVLWCFSKLLYVFFWPLYGKFFTRLS